MGNSNGKSFNKVNFENIQDFLFTKDNYVNHNSLNYLLISTLPSHIQHCLIFKTLDFNLEEETINNLLTYNTNISIIIYGMNSNDESIYSKYEQLISLGFTNVFIYPGGLFEWLCLQDIYGEEHFKTKGKELDILKYKATKNNQLLINQKMLKL